jgi:hypothetical protein
MGLLYLYYNRSKQRERHHENTKQMGKATAKKKLKNWKGRPISTTATDIE